MLSYMKNKFFYYKSTILALHSSLASPSSSSIGVIQYQHLQGPEIHKGSNWRSSCCLSESHLNCQFLLQKFHWQLIHKCLSFWFYKIGIVSMHTWLQILENWDRIYTERYVFCPACVLSPYLEAKFAFRRYSNIFQMNE